MATCLDVRPSLTYQVLPLESVLSVLSAVRGHMAGRVKGQALRSTHSFPAAPEQLSVSYGGASMYR